MKKYKKEIPLNSDFYNWLDSNTSYIEDYYGLINTFCMFDLKDLDIKLKLKNYSLKPTAINKEFLSYIFSLILWSDIKMYFS